MVDLVLFQEGHPDCGELSSTCGWFRIFADPTTCVLLHVIETRANCRSVLKNRRKGKHVLWLGLTTTVVFWVTFVVTEKANAIIAPIISCLQLRKRFFFHHCLGSGCLLFCCQMKSLLTVISAPFHFQVRGVQVLMDGRPAPMRPESNVFCFWKLLLRQDFFSTHLNSTDSGYQTVRRSRLLYVEHSRCHQWTQVTTAKRTKIEKKHAFCCRRCSCRVFLCTTTYTGPCWSLGDN